MHHKYAKDGLVVVSVSIDAIDEDNPPPKVTGEVRKFLQRFKAPFGALILDEPVEVQQKRLHFAAAPCAFVFNRSGQWTQFAGDRNEFDDKKIEERVRQALQEK
jgi:hypothetical protein